MSRHRQPLDLTEAEKIKLEARKQSLLARFFARWRFFTPAPDKCEACGKALDQVAEIRRFCSLVCRRSGRGGKRNRRLLRRMGLAA